MADELVRVSRFLALVLRHRGREFGLAPDAEGYVSLAAVAALVERERRVPDGMAAIAAVLAAGGTQRFERRGDAIRARYGHSRATPAPVVYPPVVPPPRLYHGTQARALASIRREGLRAMARQYVHLSTSVERARAVARRRTAVPVILTVDAAAAHAAGTVFYSPEPQHYLAAAIAPEFIALPPE